MSVRLVILGLLGERPLYGYEIKQIIEEHMGDWTSIAFGSIYFALDKLAEEQFVEKIATEQPGSRPSRSVYQITERGRAEFLRLLRQGWQQVEREYHALDICLFFLDRLSPEEVVGYLQARVRQLQAVQEHLTAHQAEQLSDPNVPSLAEAIFAHTAVHNKAELEWTVSLLEKIHAGAYR